MQEDIKILKEKIDFPVSEIEGQIFAVIRDQNVDDFREDFENIQKKLPKEYYIAGVARIGNGKAMVLINKKI